MDLRAIQCIESAGFGAKCNGLRKKEVLNNSWNSGKNNQVG